jgi:hypothetical protein
MVPSQMSRIGRLPTGVFTRHMKCCACGIDMVPSQMSRIGRLPTGVFTRHMKCCARGLCLECHIEFTGDRATIFDD